MRPPPSSDQPGIPSTADLQAYLHAHIPLSRAMDVAVIACSPDQVVLRAPLAPNINHRDTVFGGSASAIAILAAWALVHTRMRAEDLRGTLVIQRNTMEYDRPLNGAFTATARAPEASEWASFTRMLRRKGRGRLVVHSTLEQDGVPACRLEGEFVAVASPPA